ncbi:MAG: PhzF family phenazine biosynthesis protein [Alphaproteobacteria bacterium]|nr:PhzF family phenazine biosynthesis protein [Alphaproteobacteria bacterium]
MDLDFVTLDVFTTRTFGGNPLAVIPDARGLTTERMQAITAEFNYSESTFVLPPEDSNNTAQVRIFDPVHEMPFAGHPNVGTAVALARAGEVFGKKIGDKVCFEEKVGLVEIDLLREGADAVGARFIAPGAAEFGAMSEHEVIADVVGIDVSEITIDRHLPQLVTLGIGFVFAEVKDVVALGRCQPRLDAFKIHLPVETTDGLYLYARTGEGPEINLRSRMFSPLHGIVEDPATGSAAAMLGALLGKLEAGSNDLTVTIDQGVEMGRPSRIDVGVRRANARVDAVTVGGNAVPVMRGVITI